VEAEAVKFLWNHYRKKLEAEANLEASNFIRSWKWNKKYSTASISLDFEELISIGHISPIPIPVSQCVQFQLFYFI